VAKSQLVQRYHDNGGSLPKLLTSVSCYDAGEHHCGRCASCFKRWVALVNVAKENKWQEWGFVESPYLWKTPQLWDKAMEGYSLQRANEIRSALVYAQGTCL
jgi:hypothetical protein